MVGLECLLLNLLIFVYETLHTLVGYLSEIFNKCYLSFEIPEVLSLRKYQNTTSIVFSVIHILN